MLSLRLLPSFIVFLSKRLLLLQTGYLPFHVGFLATFLTIILIYFV